MKRQFQHIILFLFLACTSATGIAQSDSILRDGGFEHYHSQTSIEEVTSWCDCHLIDTSKYGVITPFNNNQTFEDQSLTTSQGEKALMMMTHGNGSFAAMTQRIKKKLKIGRQYNVSLDMSFSKVLNIQKENYGSEFYSYSNPVFLEVYASSAYCDHLELIYTSPIITQEEWLTYKFEFIPIERIRYLTFQVQYYGDQTYNGHLLLDNIKMEVAQD